MRITTPLIALCCWAAANGLQQPAQPGHTRTASRLSHVSRKQFLSIPFFVVAGASAANAKELSPLLTIASTGMGLLKPFFAVESGLQAGSYDATAVRAQIAQTIAENPVVVYSYTLSPFCTEAKELLTSLNAKYTVVELGAEWIPGLLNSEGSAIRAELGAMTGQTSMPHVFIKGESIGGLHSGTPGLVALLEQGSLTEKLSAASAINSPAETL
mmetsp:Transcript_41564/g.48471  ORF Transcript_41564/g.48471 Transcript_41564/m.48471 type:complete len:214 (+) Transcript_41564:36-677(+)